jgi:hypothetical protein
VASVHDVEEALARQSMYGGDLVTNLLELRVGITLEGTIFLTPTAPHLGSKSAQPSAFLARPRELGSRNRYGMRARLVATRGP